MKAIKKYAARLAVILLAALMLSGCGSELDGTWTSQADKTTKIKISGEKVRVTSEGFHLDGTYEEDAEAPNVMIFTLTADDGSKYRIRAEFSVEKNYLILKNANGDEEVFKK